MPLWTSEDRPFYVRAIGIMRAAYMLGFLIPFNINTMSIFSFSLDLCIKGGLNSGVCIDCLVLTSIWAVEKLRLHNIATSFAVHFCRICSHNVCCLTKTIKSVRFFEDMRQRWVLPCALPDGWHPALLKVVVTNLWSLGWVSRASCRSLKTFSSTMAWFLC